MLMYNKPNIYDILFSVRNYEKETDFIEKSIAKFSKIKVKSILDVGCGTGNNIISLAKRGYKTYGFDISKQMIDYAKMKSKSLDVRLFVGDMSKFKINKRVDTCINMFNSFSSMLYNKQFYSHLDSVAKTLKKGGIYIVELANPYQCWIEQKIVKKQRCNLDDAKWKVNDNVKVETEVWHVPFDPESQIERNGELRITIKDKNRTLKFTHKESSRIIFPQEFRILIENSKKFEFLKWYGNFNFEKLSRKSSKAIAILRR